MFTGKAQVKSAKLGLFSLFPGYMFGHLQVAAAFERHANWSVRQSARILCTAAVSSSYLPYGFALVLDRESSSWELP